MRTPQGENPVTRSLNKCASTGEMHLPGARTTCPHVPGPRLLESSCLPDIRWGRGEALERKDKTFSSLPGLSQLFTAQAVSVCAAVTDANIYGRRLAFFNATGSVDLQLMGQQNPHVQPFTALHPWLTAKLAPGAAGLPGSSAWEDGAARTAGEQLVQAYAGTFGWADKLQLCTWWCGCCWWDTCCTKNRVKWGKRNRR